MTNLSISLRNALSVDVEDYFQVQAFANVVDRSRWDEIPCRVEANTERLLDTFNQAGVTATFFTLGWVAERFPRLVRRIVENGHELASHGHGHALVHTLTPEEFREDLIRAKGFLESAGGVGVQGYRAPTFSIGPRTSWAFDILFETGHRYSSSIYPVKHDIYGVPDAPRFPYQPSSAPFLEIPMTTLRIVRRNVPIAGGGYFRLMPYTLYRSLLHRFNRKEGRPSIFYFHPWEIDPAQPRIRTAPVRARFRHGINLRLMLPRVEQLLRDFKWGRIDQVFARELAGLNGHEN